MDNLIEMISGNLAEMRLIVEGAVSLFEKSKDADSEVYALMGEALYLIRERVIESLNVYQEYGKTVR